MKTLVPAIALAILGLPLTAQVPDGTRDPFAIQAARTQAVATTYKKAHYPPDRFNLEDLPPYIPGPKVSGLIRMWGIDFLEAGNLKNYWQAGFHAFKPGIAFEFNLKTTLLALNGLIAGVSDIGPSRRITFEELLAFQRVYGYDPLEVVGMTGALDVPGFTPTLAIMINRKNPIDHLSLKQLDGIFGAERQGGWLGMTWHPEFKRGPEKNIRTWGQLGLTGGWADKPIHVYGFNLRYTTAERFSDDVLHGSDKWNEQIRFYANYAAPDGSLITSNPQILKDLAKDPCGIAYNFIIPMPPEVKMIALASEEGGAAVEPTLETVRNHTYPLYDQVFFYINRKPGTPLDPKLKEFMRYVLSREGQQEVARDGKWLPLTPDFVREQLKKL